jgi:putative aldouronate transport system substrate-binding protein
MGLHAMDTPNLDGAIWRALEAATNVTITAEFWEPAVATERTNLLLASGRLPDLVYVSRVQANSYGDDGMFAPLDDLIAAYGPNIMSFMTAENQTPMRNPSNGLIYMIGKYNTLAEAPDQMLIYRKDILDAMGEPEPTTMDEWYRLFQRVQQQFPDMIPLTAHTGGIEGNVFHAFDMGRLDGYHGIIGSEFDRGRWEVKFIPTTPQWRTMLEYFNKLFNEGLLDNNYLTYQWAPFWNTNMVGGRAFACWTLNWARADMANEEAAAAGLGHIQWVTAKTPMNQNGIRANYRTTNPWGAAGFAFNARSDNHVAAMEFLDFLFSEPGMNLMLYGIEGDHWVRNADGQPERLLPFLENERIRFAEGYLFNLPGYSPVEHVHDPNMLNMSMHFGTNTQFLRVLPTISRLPQTSEEYTRLNADLQTYVLSQRDAFITGLRSFDEWDNYVHTVNTTYRATRTVAIVQEWVDNYYRLAGQ